MTQLNNVMLTKEMVTFCPLPRLDSTGEKNRPIENCQNLLDNGASLQDELKDLYRVLYILAMPRAQNMDRRRNFLMRSKN